MNKFLQKNVIFSTTKKFRFKIFLSNRRFPCSVPGKIETSKPKFQNVIGPK